MLVGDDEVKGTFFLISAVTSGGGVETNGDTEIASDHDVIVVDGVVIGCEFACQTFPLPVRHDALGQRLFDAVPTSLGGITVEARSIVCQIERQGVDDTVELISDSACLELIDDIVVAQVSMGSQTTLDHMLDEAKSMQVKLTRARSWCGDSMLGLFPDFLG